MSIARKIARRMAKTQMKKDGIQHPCRPFRGQQIVLGAGATPAPRVSYFSSHWREAAAKYKAELPYTRKRKPTRRTKNFIRVGA